MTKFTNMEKIGYVNENKLEVEQVVKISSLLSVSALTIAENIEFYIISSVIFCKILIDQFHTVVIEL